MNLTGKIFILLFCGCCNNSFGQIHTVFFAGPKGITTQKECEYETKSGRLEGKYTSWYGTGKKHVEGRFENNYPSGKWTLWDMSGQKKIVRYYINPFVYKQVLPKVETEGPIPLLNQPVYQLKYNSGGYINYFHAEEGDIYWNKRLWRTISKENNLLLFDNDRLFNVIRTNIMNGNIKIYSEDNFKVINVVEQTNEKNKKEKLNIIGYKIKEDLFLDTKRFVSEHRIIAICPIGVTPTTNDTTEVGWIYFPDIRKYLAMEKLNAAGLPSNIKTLDDLFFFRYFASDIYKESNVFDRKITDYAKSSDEIKKEQERILLECIEAEHSFWQYFSR